MGAGALLTGLIVEAVLDGANRRAWEARGRGPQPIYTWTFHTSDGRKLGRKHGELKLVLHPLRVYANMPNQKTSRFTINSLGLRGPEIGPKVPGRPRIVVLGGSTAFGTGLDSDADTAAPRLGQELGAEVLNAAVLGYESSQELVYLVTEILDLGPDLVIDFGGFNDFGESLKPALEPRSFGVNGFQEIEDHLRESQDLTAAPLARRLAASPRVLFPLTSLWLKSRLSGGPYRPPAPAGRAQAGNAQEPGAAAPRAALPASTATGEGAAPANPGAPAAGSPFAGPIGPAELDARVREVGERYVANLSRMSRVMSASGGAFLCAIQPFQDKPGPVYGLDPWSGGYLRFRRHVKPRLAELGVHAADLNDHASELGSDFWLDRAHLDARGQRILARLLASEIRRRKLLKTPR